MISYRNGRNPFYSCQNCTEFDDEKLTCNLGRYVINSTCNPGQFVIECERAAYWADGYVAALKDVDIDSETNPQP